MELGLAWKTEALESPSRCVSAGWSRTDRASAGRLHEYCANVFWLMYFDSLSLIFQLLHLSM